MSVSIDVMRCDGVLLIFIFCSARLSANENCRNVCKQSEHGSNPFANKSSGVKETNVAGNVIRAEWERCQHTKSSSCSVLKHQKRREYYYKITVHVRTQPESRRAREKESAFAERRDTSIVNKYNVIYRSYLVTQTYFTMCTERYTQLIFFSYRCSLSLFLFGWFVCCRFSSNSFPCSDQRFLFFFFHLARWFVRSCSFLFLCNIKFAWRAYLLFMIDWLCAVSFEIWCRWFFAACKNAYR